MIRRTALASAAALSLLALQPSSAATAPTMANLSFNHDCIAPPMVVLVDGDCDGNGVVFTDTAGMPKAGPITLKGIPFRFPDRGSGVNNTAVALGQTLSLPGKKGYGFVHLLAFGVNGAASSSEATVTYTDGKTAKGSIRVADWTSPAGAVIDMLKHGTDHPVGVPAGGLQDVGHAYIATIKVDPKKTVKSIKLPQTTQPSTTNVSVFGQPPAIHVFAITLSATPSQGAGKPVFN